MHYLTFVLTLGIYTTEGKFKKNNNNIHNIGDSSPALQSAVSANCWQVVCVFDT